MAIATITKITLSGTLTTVLIANGIRDALIAVGYVLFHSYTNGSSEVRVMALQQSSATRGTVYLSIAINSVGITYQLHENWNNQTTPGTPTNSSGSTLIATSTGSMGMTLYAINHPEFKGLSVEQGAVQGVLGVMRPLRNNLIPSWWDENLFPYAFLPRPSTTPSSTRFGTTTTPPNGSNLDHEYNNFSKMQDGNPQNNDSRSTIPFWIWRFGVDGILSISDDIVVCASNTMKLMDKATVSSSEIYTFFWINSTNSGLAIRTV